MSESKWYVCSNHDKGHQEAYRSVPGLFSAILDLIPELEGFVIGGSYAKGEFAPGNDVDVDLLFSLHPGMHRLKEIKLQVQEMTSRGGLQVHVRAPLASNLISETVAKGTYREGTPFVVRRREIADYWGLQ